MTLTKDKQTGFYTARIKLPEGGSKTLSTKARTKPEAKRILKQSRLAEIEEAAKAGKLQDQGLAYVLTGKHLSFTEAVLAYLECQRNRGRATMYVHSTHKTLMQFLRSQYLEDKALVSLTDAMVDKFINAPGERSYAWRKGQHTALIKFTEFCNDKGWIRGNPAKLTNVRMEGLTHAQKETKQRNPFNDQEIGKLLGKTDPGSFWHSAIAISRYTGLRLGDVAQLEWETLRTPGKITVWTEKRDKRINLDLDPVLAKALLATPPNGSPFLFPEQAAVAKDPVRRPNLSTYFRRVCIDAGIEGKTFHDIRACYVSDCEARGIPMPHIARAVGHSHFRTTVGYLSKEQKGKYE